MALLLVEDNSRLAASLHRGLAEDGFAVACAGTGTEALDRLERSADPNRKEPSP
jgi:DNA-binding response OmpR family regulator